MASPGLPSPREFLSTLVSTLSATLESHGPTSAGTSARPLEHAAASTRNIITTLHVLFPSTLLPALDLLDRGLVTALRPVKPGSREAPLAEPSVTTTTTTTPPRPGNMRLDARGMPGPLSGLTDDARVFLVRSAQDPRAKLHRRSNSSGGGGGGGTASTPTDRTYIVRLGPWSCTCAAFAFSAFPAAPEGFLPRFVESDQDSHVLPASRMRQDWTSNFGLGGFSFDGVGEDGGRPACCKHLLACVLSQSLGQVVNEGIKEREVGREEMAGLGIGD